MTADPKKTSVGKPAIGGGVFRAPLGTTLPTDATTDLASAYKNMGYISDDGVVNSKTRENTEVNAWGGDKVRDLQTKKTDTFQMTFIEARNTEVLKAVHGDDNVTQSGGMITIRENAKELDNAVWVIDEIMNDGYLKRTVIPDGKVTDVGDVTHKDDTLLGYQATISAYPHSAYGGDTHREFIEAEDEIGELTVTSEAGSTSGKTKITIAEAKGSGNIYKIMIDLAAETVELDQDVSTWTTWNGSDDITAATGKVITVVEATSDGHAVKVGSQTVTAKA